MFKKIFAFAFPCLIAGCLLESDDKRSGTVDNSDTGVQAMIFNPDGTPAISAKVAVYESGDTSRVPSRIVNTDSAGRYSLKGLKKGVYNVLSEKESLVAFQDSILVTEDTAFVENDTLGASKTVTALVGLQPQHDPRTVVAQILGTDKFSNVNSDGYFTFPNLAQGNYNLKLSTTLSGYTQTFFTLAINGSAPDTLVDTLWMVYTDIPVVEGLEVNYDSLTGQVVLNWEESDYRNFEEYVVYKDVYNSIQPQYTPLAVTVQNSFQENLFEDPSYIGVVGQFMRHHYKYRVAVRSNSASTGPTYKFVEVNGPLKETLLAHQSPPYFMNYDSTQAVTFDWSDISGVLGYEFSLSDSSSGGFSVLQYTDTSGIVLSDLEPGEYIWRFRAQILDSGWSAWSSMRHFSYRDTVGPLLDPPNVISPQNGDSVNAVVRFEIDSIGWYSMIHLSRDSSFSNCDSIYISSTEYYSLSVGTYYWRIASYNPNNHLGPWSPTYTFTVLDSNEVFLLYPATNSTFSEKDSIHFGWSSSHSVFSWYQVVLGTEDSLITTSDTLINNVTNYSTSLPPGNYSWYVQGQLHTWDILIESETRFFTVVKDSL